MLQSDHVVAQNTIICMETWNTSLYTWSDCYNNQ